MTGLLLQEALRDKVIFLLGISDKLSREVLDPYNGEQRLFIHILHQKYIDKECVVYN